MKLKNIKDTSLFKDLKDPEFVAGYLENILQENSKNAFLLALRNVAEANGGITKLAKITKLGRESMYKSLSEDGNPQFSTVETILKGLGLKFSITVNKKEAA